MFDEDNFSFVLEGHDYTMVNGELKINNCHYEEYLSDGKPDVLYSLVRNYARKIVAESLNIK